MYQFLFRNKWAALAFVVLTLASVQMLVGREGEKSVISRTQDQLLERREHMQSAMDDIGNNPAAAAVDPQTAADSETQIGFGDDDELIDDASGFDPTPDEEQPAEPSNDQQDSDK